MLVTLFVGILVLVIGFFAGLLLANLAKDELKQGKKWFKMIIFVSLFSALLSFILGNDILLFSFLFIAVVTSRSWKSF
jgi:ABC-type sugar transport system permease subunit